MNRQAIVLLIFIIITLVGITAGCGKLNDTTSDSNTSNMENVITPTDKISKLEDELYAVKYEGDYGFDEFLNQGGAASDKDVIRFLAENVLSDVDLSFAKKIFGCSAISVQDTDGSWLFGRNFDWNHCRAMIISTQPENSFASVSTVNMDFITSGTGLSLKRLPDEIQTIAGIYAPLDGMNEKGLCVAVNMISDSDSIEQNTKNPDITTTTAVRLLLDKAANTQEAVDLLKSYDFHASLGMMIHFAISDADGKSVVVEYIDNEISVIETPIVTNFYLSQGDKYGIGTNQSHTRYEILESKLLEMPQMSESDVKDALSSVSKKNFGEFESTEWSIVYNKTAGTARYFHRENYDKSYIFTVNQ